MHSPLNDPNPPLPGEAHLGEAIRRGQRLKARRRGARAAGGGAVAVLLAGATFALTQGHDHHQVNLRTAAAPATTPAAPAASSTTGPPTTVTPTTAATVTPATSATAAPAATAPPTVPSASTTTAPAACYAQPPRRPYTATGAGNGMTFTYPACWATQTLAEGSSFSTPIVNLSDAPMHDPCTTTQGSAGTTTSCSPFPVTSLPPGDTLVMWSNNGGPTPQGQNALDSAPGSPTTVGGQPAREAVTAPGNCGQIGAAETIEVNIAMPGSHSGLYNMVACLSSEGEKQQATQIKEMLASVMIPR